MVYRGLSYENWEEIFMEDDASTSFNKFQNIILRLFYSCFIKNQIKTNSNSRPWITKGIKTSCTRKRELYLMMRDNTNTNNTEMEHKMYYKRYCKLLSTVTKEAKKIIL